MAGAAPPPPPSSMNPLLVRKLVLPLLMRRTWPGVLRERRALEKSQWLPAADLRALQVERARGLVRRAMERSPWYREVYGARGVDPDAIRSLDDLRRLPILEKADLKRERERILLVGADRAKITQGATGGTTGEPTHYYWDDAYWCRSSAVTQRAYGFLGFEPGDRHVMIWGTSLPVDARSLRREIRNYRRRNILLVPGFDLSEETMARHAEAIRRHRPKVIEGYVSLLVLFGGFLERSGIRLDPPHALVSSAERLFPFQREAIERAFGAPLHDRYGTREVGCIASECGRHTGLHVAAEHVIVETVRGDESVPPGESGEIVVTCLSNEVFPFLRYRIGDLGALLPDPCPCGRGLPLLAMTGGRVCELITTARGTWLPGVFFPHLFKEFPGVGAFQVRQARDRAVEIRIVRTEAWTPEQEERYAAEIRKVLGEDLPVAYVHVERIETTAAGKLRPTMSEVPVDLVRQKAAL